MQPNQQSYPWSDALEHGQDLLVQTATGFPKTNQTLFQIVFSCLLDLSKTPWDNTSNTCPIWVISASPEITATLESRLKAWEVTYGVLGTSPIHQLEDITKRLVWIIPAESWDNITDWPAPLYLIVDHAHALLPGFPLSPAYSGLYHWLKEPSDSQRLLVSQVLPPPKIQKLKECLTQDHQRITLPLAKFNTSIQIIHTSTFSSQLKQTLALIEKASYLSEVLLVANAETVLPTVIQQAACTRCNSDEVGFFIHEQTHLILWDVPSSLDVVLGLALSFAETRPETQLNISVMVNSQQWQLFRKQHSKQSVAVNKLKMLKTWLSQTTCPWQSLMQYWQGARKLPHIPVCGQCSQCKNHKG